MRIRDFGSDAAASAEHARLAADVGKEHGWRRWGPYLSERQWGTVREDYSADGDAWRYFPHDHARSRAYRWGEDGGVAVRHPKLPPHRLYCDGTPRILFCDNDTNPDIYRDTGPDSVADRDSDRDRDADPESIRVATAQGYFKDAFHEFVVGGRTEAVNPANTGTKAAALYRLRIPAGRSIRLRLRLTPGAMAAPFDGFETVFAQRRAEADRFYDIVLAGAPSDDAKRVLRQAYAGLLWSKQFYYYDVAEWLDGDPLQPPPPAARRHGRNDPNGQIPAYEWNMAIPDKVWVPPTRPAGRA